MAQLPIAGHSCHYILRKCTDVNLLPPSSNVKDDGRLPSGHLCSRRLLFLRMQALLLLLALTPATTASAAATAPTERLAAYYESWAPTPPNATHPLAAVPCYITDVILAFLQPSESLAA